MKPSTENHETWTGRPESGLPGHLLSAVLGREPPAERYDCGAGQERQERHARGGVVDEARETPVVQDHLARDVAEDPAADPDDPDKAVHEHGQETTPPHDDRQREPDAEGDEEEIAVRGGCDGEHSVEAHDRVCQDAEPELTPERAALPDVRPCPRPLTDAVERRPKQHKP